MVDVNFETNYDKKVSVATCPEKSKATFTIQTAPGGFIFYRVISDLGRVPEDLAGKFTSIENAQRAIRTYFNNMKPSTGVRRDEVRARIEQKKAEKNATETVAETSDDLHKGSDN